MTTWWRLSLTSQQENLFPSEMSTLDIVLKRGIERVEVDSSQITTDTLRRTFRVDPNEVWLRAEDDNKAFYPDDITGHFNLHEVGLPFLAVMVVEGPSTASGGSGVSVSSTARSSGYGASTSYSASPAFKPVLASNKREAVCSVKIVKAKMKGNGSGKPEFEAQKQMHIEVSESNANVTSVLNQMRQQWGEEYSLVSNDGLVMEDCEGTRGLKFWKSPRRKVFAVMLKSTKRKRLCSDDDDDDEPLPKRNLEMKLDMLMDDVSTIKDSIADIFSLNQQSKLPIGMKKLLKDSFQCKICHSSMTPPIIMSKCCESIIGCEECVNTWFEGPNIQTKNCPGCARARGYSKTLSLKGLGTFLEEIKKVVNDD